MFYGVLFIGVSGLLEFVLLVMFLYGVFFVLLFNVMFMRLYFIVFLLYPFGDYNC